MENCTSLENQTNYEVIDSELIEEKVKDLTPRGKQIDSTPCGKQIDFIEFKDNNKNEMFNKISIEKCLDKNNCNHIIMFYMNDNSIHSCAKMSKNYILLLFKRFGMKLPDHFE